MLCRSNHHFVFSVLSLLFLANQATAQDYGYGDTDTLYQIYMQQMANSSTDNSGGLTNYCEPMYISLSSPYNFNSMNDVGNNNFFCDAIVEEVITPKTDPLTDNKNCLNQEHDPEFCWQDLDADGVPDYMEDFAGTDTLNNNDSDGDGLADDYELLQSHTDRYNTDTDQDFLSDYEEIMYFHSNPNNPDMDNDGLKDGEEVKVFITSPFFEDSDLDKLKDGDELLKHNTNPTEHDTDGDQLSDGDEILLFSTNPLNPDTDGGGVNDRIEILLNQDPNDALDDINTPLS